MQTELRNVAAVTDAHRAPRLRTHRVRAQITGNLFGRARQPARDKHGHVTLAPPLPHSPVNKLGRGTRSHYAAPREPGQVIGVGRSTPARWVAGPPACRSRVGEGTAMMYAETGRAGATRSKAGRSSITPVLTAPTAEPHSNAGLPVIPWL